MGSILGSHYFGKLPSPPAGLYWDNGKENGNYHIMVYILGLYRDNGKENGNYYNGLYRDYIGYILGLYWDNSKRKWKLLQLVV